MSQSESAIPSVTETLRVQRQERLAREAEAARRAAAEAASQNSKR